MKRVLFLVLSLFFLLVGCSAVEDLTSNITGSDGDSSGNASASTVYEDLNTHIINPSSPYLPASLDGNFTFYAMILSDSHEMTFDDDTGGIYHEAAISRNAKDYFFLNVTDVEGEFAPGDIVEVTGELNGLVYWTEDNSQVDILDIKASKIAPYTPEEIEPNTTGIFTLEDGNEVEFIGAHRSTDNFDDVIVVYFSFTNHGSKDAAPNFSSFYVEYNTEEVSTTIFPPEEVDSRALESGNFGDSTYAGKTQLYYKVYTIPSTASADEPIYFLRYDDSFRMTDAAALYVFPSLTDMNAAEETVDAADTDAETNTENDEEFLDE